METEFSEEIRSLEQKVASHSMVDSYAFYGSSSIRLWETLHDDMGSRNVINLGFGGSSYGWMAHYYERLFAGSKHDHIILYSGDNDHSKGQLSERILRNFRRLTHEIWHDNPNAHVHVISVKPSPLRVEQLTKIKETNHLLRSSILAKENGHWIDVYQPMLSPEGNPRPELFVEDMLHMNAQGYAIWKHELLKHFENLGI